MKTRSVFVIAVFAFAVPTAHADDKREGSKGAEVKTLQAQPAPSMKHSAA